MKKILYSIFSAVALLGIAACSNNDGELLGSLNMGGTPNAPTTIVATTESSATTRTALQSDGENGYNVVWSEGDKITLQGSNSPTVYPSVEYALQEGAGTTKGTFEPVAVAIDWKNCNKVEAFYAVKDMEWPAEQTYSGEDVISNAPMYCSVYNQYAEPNLEFKNMGGILRLTLKGLCAIKRIVITTPDNAISGQISEISSLGTAKISDDGGHTITLQMSENVQLDMEGKTFNIAMPSSGEDGYANVQIKIIDECDNEIVKTMASGKKLVILHSKITNVSISAHGKTGVAKRSDGRFVDWVQLWKNGPRFATINVGSDDVGGVGGYYCWGGSIGIQNFEEEHPEQRYYNTGTSKLTGDYDTATKLWGKNWRMPTRDEFYNLMSNCDCTFEENNGLNGVRCTGKEDYSDCSIFLQAAGWDYSYCHKLWQYNELGEYWTSSPTPHDEIHVYDNLSQFLLFKDYNKSLYWTCEYNGWRYEGKSVRAVLNE